MDTTDPTGPAITVTITAGGAIATAPGFVKATLQEAKDAKLYKREPRVRVAS